MMYRIPEPMECFECGGPCYARDWWDSSTTGTPYAEGISKVSWQCAQCGRRFYTMECVDEILTEVEEIPLSYKEIKYLKTAEE